MSHTCHCRCRDGGSASETITPLAFRTEETVETAMRRSPRAPEVLRAFGIDTCCGGRLTLAQAAASRGIPVETLVRALEEVRETREGR